MFIKSIGRAPQAGKFKNSEPTQVMRENASYFAMAADYFHKPKSVTPSRTLPSIKTDLRTLHDAAPTIVWFGHSSYLIKYHGFTILVDPVLFGNSASPFSFIGKPFPVTQSYEPADLPDIDLLLLTHDHYDHLSFETLSTIKNKIKKIVAPIGVGSHLIYWGFEKNMITEINWNDKITISPFLEIIAAPARHFSGRFFSRNKTLWTAYVATWGSYKIFIGGDSGYDGQFKRTGNDHGPFDLAILECGQYGRDWPNIHMFPEEVARAAKDLRAKVLLPVHWAKFVLSIHAWNEPIKRLLKASAGADYKIITPMIGAQYVLDTSADTKTEGGGEWWRDD
jgi:L-ascorbate metabolism protein UlaG (beta-lactamase superfamily)